jgi:hypothetical protein
MIAPPRPPHSTSTEVVGVADCCLRSPSTASVGLAALPADQIEARAAVRIGQVGDDRTLLVFAAVGEQLLTAPWNRQLVVSRRWWKYGEVA